MEKDYRFYDPPRRVWTKITQAMWPYSTKIDHYRRRDLAFMSILYMTCARVGEVARADVYLSRVDEHTVLPSVTKDQFVIFDDFIHVRNLRIVKRKVEKPDDYPKRREILIPLKGDLSIFANPITTYLKTVEDREGELFPFKQKRGHQIVRTVTGEFPHYLRDMGLKLRLRIYGMNIASLKGFSGHVRLENLIRYLEEAESREALLAWKFT